MQNPTPVNDSRTAKLPANLLKALIGVVLVVIIMLLIVRSGAMRRYEQPVRDTTQGDHQSSQNTLGP